jgi:DNA ligase-1
MNELQTVFNICKELQNTSSTIEKQNILRRNENNELFKDILKFLLDNQIVTGISKKKIEKQIDYINTDNATYDIRSLLSYLKEHNTGTDNDIIYCRKFLNHNKELNAFIKSIITKSLKLGVDVKTVNKVYGKTFITVLNVMLGTSIEKCKIPEGTWFSISQKLNGSRCFYYKGKLYTRQGKVYSGCEHIIKDIEKFNTYYTNGEDWVYDGELILRDDSLSDSEAFQKGVGIANSDKESKEELRLVIFDVLPIKEFEEGKSNLTYKNRKTVLKSCENGIEKLNLSNISIVPMFYEGTDQKEIWKWLDYAEAKGFEGTVVNLDAPYECKRTKNLIKCKKFFDIDLRCIGVEKGSGKYTDTLGAIICNYKDNELRVGSGFTDEQRNFYFNNPNEIVGKVVTVKYKEETKNKSGGMSLQFPVFQCVRFDKNTVDE